MIGSGIGGLTTAGLLARAAGKRVLVLERHTEPGGLTHTFRRDGASWDVGVHYIGHLSPGSQGRAYFDYLSGGELEWNRMPNAYDRFVYPGVDLCVSSDPDRYERDLVAAFPQEARAIHRYFQDVQQVTRWVTLGFVQGMVPRPAASLLRAAQRLGGRRATGTTKAYLDAHFRSPELKAVLASQWGDYGLPPSQSAFAVHALIVSHYLEGAWFPSGGSARIARTFEKGIEQAGGAVRVAQEVTEILTENGAAVGVRVTDHRGAQVNERVYRAPVIVSAIGASNTFNRLLPTSGKIGRRTESARRTLKHLGTGTSAVSVFLRLRDDPRSIGIDGGNIWVNRDLDHEGAQRSSNSLLEGHPHNIFVSFSSLNSGETPHTAELTSFCEAKVFQQWAEHPRGHRGPEYSALKERIARGMLELAESAAPGLTGLVDDAETSTPLTYEHYTAHPAGAFYGSPATPLRFRSRPLGPRTAVSGLFLSGQDAGSTGIMGAMTGGVAAACQVLGPRGYSTITSALRTPPAPSVSRGGHALPEGKHRATLVSKRRLTPSVWEAVLQLDGRIGPWAPGQFARLHVGDDAWRDYSIAGLEEDRLRLLISTRTGGRGSQFIENVDTGARTVVELPLGGFGLADSTRRRLFIATGTGIAPMLAMFAQAPGLEHDTLLFGCRHQEEDLTTRISSPMPGTVVRCLSREEVPDAFHGRVTQAVTALAHDLQLDPDGTDVYLCGSAAMVADTRHVLEHEGYTSILTEPY